MGFNQARQTINTNQPVTVSNPVIVPSVPINQNPPVSNIMYSQGQQTPRNNIVSYKNYPPNYYPRPQSPRVSQPAQNLPPHIYHNIGQAATNPGLNYAPSLPSVIQTHVPINSVNSSSMYHPIGTTPINMMPINPNPVSNYSQQQYNHIAPLKPSNI